MNDKAEVSVLAAVLCLVGAAAGPAFAGTLNVLHGFTGAMDGATPNKGLTPDKKGNLYGTTFYGADACPDSYEYAGVGCGVVFKIDSAGNFSTLVTFAGSSNGASGEALTLKGSTLYGTAYTGGTSNQGLVFSVKTDGTGFKILHDFSGTDGANPNSYLRIDSAGNMYSEAPFGGPGFTGSNFTGEGLIFEITKKKQFIAQHYFSGGADGGQPGRIVLDASGTIFGATTSGGSCSGSGLPANGCGVIYSFVPSTATFTTLYTFSGGSDGYVPQIGAVDGNGDLFGVTTYGGANNSGTLFELQNVSGVYSYRTLWAFTGGVDGSQPDAPPVLASNGKLYGTTVFSQTAAGTSAAGTLFSFAKGKLSTLYTFVNDANGGYPEATPTIGKAGVITGTTSFGGNAPCDTTGGTLISSYGCGVVYSYKP